MKDLFYSNSEKILFQIAGYTQDHHLSNVVEMILSSNAKEFQTIKNKIEKAIENGEFKTTIYNNIHPTIVDKLKEDGYAISEYTRDPRGENSTTISW